MTSRARLELLRGDIRRVERARGEVHVDEQRQQRRGRRARWIDLVESPFEDVLGARHLPLRQMDGRKRAGRVHVAVEALE